VRRSKPKSLIEGRLAGVAVGVWILSTRYDECTCVRAWITIDGEQVINFCTRAKYRSAESSPELNDPPRHHGKVLSQFVQPDPQSIAAHIEPRCARVVPMRGGLIEARR
jgi:hypothetical protein